MTMLLRTMITLVVIRRLILIIVIGMTWGDRNT
jgi:hypothetical protein